MFHSVEKLSTQPTPQTTNVIHLSFNKSSASQTFRSTAKRFEKFNLKKKQQFKNVTVWYTMFNKVILYKEL